MPGIQLRVLRQAVTFAAGPVATGRHCPAFECWRTPAADSPKQAASGECRCTYREPAPPKDGRYGCQGLLGRRLGCAWRDHLWPSSRVEHAGVLERRPGAAIGAPVTSDFALDRSGTYRTDSVSGTACKPSANRAARPACAVLAAANARVACCPRVSGRAGGGLRQRHRSSPTEAGVISAYPYGRGLQMIAKRVRAGRAETGMLPEVQWASANAAVIADALAAALP